MLNRSAEPARLDDDVDRSARCIDGETTVSACDGPGLAAVGSTFYDDEVEGFLCPGKSPLLCTAVGRR